MLEIIGFIVLVLFDQWTKYLTVEHLANGGKAIQLIDGVFELTYVENTGAAFGLFKDGTLFLSIIVIVVVIAILYFKRKLPRTKEFLPLHVLAVFIIAGAIGNLIDRIRLHFVVDMLHFYWFEFPVFNVADIYLTVSAAVLFLLLLTKYKDLELK